MAEKGNLVSRFGLGMFGAKPRRLEALGIMENVRLRKQENGASYYMGDFVFPLTLKTFLERPLVQYGIFVENLKDLRKQIEATPRLLGMLGTEVDVNAKGESISLSGLLALVNAAGIKGAYKWLTTEQDRQRFPNTTKAFLQSNGIF